MGVIDALTRPILDAHDPEVISTDVPALTTVLVSTIYFCCALLLLVHWRSVLKATRRVWPMLLLPGLAFVSMCWSHAPLLTARRSTFLTVSTLLGIYLGDRFSLEELARLLVQALCPMMVAVLILYLIAPNIVVENVSYVGALKGLSGAKNTFGGYMAIAVPLLFLVRFKRYQRTRYLFLALAAAFLLLSRSATSLGTCILTFAAMPLWRFAANSRNRKMLAFTLVAAVVAACLSLMWIERQSVLSIVQRDATLTGRTELWSFILAAIAEHPLLGYGYGAFWSGINADTVNLYKGVRWLPNDADNGYLDLCLAFGIPGLLLLLFVFKRAFESAYKYISQNGEAIGLWPITYVVYFVVHNTCESHLLTTRSLDYFLLTAIIASIASRHRLQETLSIAHTPSTRRHKMPSIAVLR
jgi:O-antigen ligase